MDIIGTLLMISGVLIIAYFYFVSRLAIQKEAEITEACLFEGPHQLCFCGFGKEPRKDSAGNYLISWVEIKKMMGHELGRLIPDKYCYFICAKCLKVMAVKTDSSKGAIGTPIILRQED